MKVWMKVDFAGFLSDLPVLEKIMAYDDAEMLADKSSGIFAA
jgi:hypothetical protein